MAKKAAQGPDIEQVLEQLLEVKTQQANLKEQEEKLQEKVDAYSNEHFHEFVDNALSLNKGVIKLVQNPPKLVHEGSEKALTDKDRVALCEVLPTDYVETKPNLTKIIARLHGDKSLKQLLKAKGIGIVQNSRYQVKAY
jgi:hypothetical protein